MITYVLGDLFESPARVLVNTVNTVGVMGKGIAKDFKRIYPEMFREYQKHCETKRLTVGKLWLYKTSNKWILNFPTKTTWRKPSEIQFIESGLNTFVREYAKRGITSVAFPPLGCGNGELDWDRQVQPLMENYLRKLPIDIFIHLYRQDLRVPEHRDKKAVASWLRSDLESLGFVEVWKDLTELIGSGLDLRTSSDHEIFHVKVISEIDEQGICFYMDDKKTFVPEEELIELWTTVRNCGFVIPGIMPAGLDLISNQIVALFSELPYCRSVSASKDYLALSSSQSIGLQIVPQAIPPKIFEKLPFELKPV